MMRIHIETAGNSSWAKRPRNTYKIIAIVVIVLVTIVLIGASCYFLIKMANDEEFNTQIANENVVAPIGQNEEQKLSEEEPIFVELPTEQEQYIPVMTEEGMYNIQHIYTVEDDDERRVFLTFDDGPSEDITEPILDILKQENIKATFFVLGNRAKAYPEIVKREYDEGHYVANHGYSHVYSKIYDSADAVINEIERTDEAIAEALGIEGYQTHLFRFPGGSVGGYDTVKTEAKEMLKERNIAYLDWNALTRDSEGRFSKEQLIENLQNTVGSKKSLVILCHDAAGKTTTYEALPEIIELLRNDGYTFADMRDFIK